MTEYLICVVGMTVLSVVVDLVLPTGKISAFVRTIASLFLFFVIVLPILNFTKNTNAIDNLTNNIQNNFYYDISESQVTSTKKVISMALNKEYNASFDVEIEFISENGVAKILAIDIFVANNDQSLNSNDIETIKNMVSKYCENAEVRVYAR